MPGMPGKPDEPTIPRGPYKEEMLSINEKYSKYSCKRMN